MTGDGRKGETVTVLGGAGAVIFSPVVLGLFDAGLEVRVFGLPLLIFYVFAAWAALIAVIAVLSRGISDPPDLPGPQKPTGSWQAKDPDS